uniref:Galactosylgalactosylxylosylprotein 3-beta-glucuronosyltransferase n=1 Tax=Plectus sambesii TaxID=2011161 RepID=A0A914XC34_9BILA
MPFDTNLVSSCGRTLLSREKPEIVFITPTNEKFTQLADLTRLSQTLSLVSNIQWIIIEDRAQKSEKLVKLLNRIKVPSIHLNLKTPPAFPGRGWAQRNYALEYIRNKYQSATGNELKKIVYFGDDDNAYDIRLFDNYIRNVKRIGVWPVGLTYGGVVEAPRVNQDSRVVGWNSLWRPDRMFATDMAGFAISLDLVLNTNATFAASCDKRQLGPETCFIELLGVQRGDLEPFGVNDQPKEVLVWHTRTE